MSYPNNKRERLLIGQRKGRKRVSQWFLGSLFGNEEENKELRERFAKQHRDITKKCSALWCCGNPRRRGELTSQEIKFLDSLKD
jgi:hypothetical protein